MKLATLSIQGRTRFGALQDGGLVDLGARLPQCRDLTDVFAQGLLDQAAAQCQGARPDVSLEGATWLPPFTRSDLRVFAIGWAYRDHQTETGKEAPAFPSIFTKFASSLVGHGQPLRKPAASDSFDYEGEVALIIGKGGRDIPADRGLDHIAGFSILMDGSVRDWQKHSIPAGKNFDASSAFGPCIVTRDEIADPKAMQLTTRLNGQVMQQSPFGNMVWDLGYLVNYLSTITELRPGDVISTGTPSGVGSRRTPPVFMKRGDLLDIEVSGIGHLQNPIQ